MKHNPDALAWFTKPEKAMKQRINDYVNEKQKESQKLIEQVGNLKLLVNHQMI